MANTIVTTDLLVKEGMRILHNKLSFCKIVNRDYTSDFTGTPKTGTSIRIRKPAQWSVRTGDTFSAENLLEETQTLTLDQKKGIDVSISSDEMSLSLDDISSRVLVPQMSRLATAVESILINDAAVNAQAASLSGSNLAWGDVAQARAELAKNTAPVDDECYMFCNPNDQVNILTDTKGLFQSSSAISDQYLKGQMGVGGGFTFMETNLLSTITPMADVAGTVNDTVVNGDTTITLAALGATQAIAAGMIFTIAAVNSINPETKDDSGELFKFKVLSATTTTGGGAATVTVHPMFDNTDSRQNISALPANTAVVTFLGTASTAYNQNLFMHKDSYTAAFADLPLPQGVDRASKATLDGITLRLIQDYDIDTDVFKSRFDVLFGGAPLRSEWAGILAEQ